jgi:hypothetical protein
MTCVESQASYALWVERLFGRGVLPRIANVASAFAGNPWMKGSIRLVGNQVGIPIVELAWRKLILHSRAASGDEEALSGVTRL